MNPLYPNRNTGRTTGLALKALAEAVLNRGAAVEFKDHHFVKTGGAWASNASAMIINMADALALIDVEVWVEDDSRVFVQSNFKNEKEKTNEPA